MTAAAWCDSAPLQHIRSHPATAVWGDKIYVFGGGGPRFKSLNTVEVYDPKADRWEQAAPMPTLRSGAVAAVIDGLIYVIGGGFCKDDGKFRFLPTTEVYDPATDRWSDGPDMTRPHDYPACVVDGRTIYVLGGHHPDATEGGPSSDPGFDYCERWTVGQPGWAAIAPFTEPRFAPVGISWQGKVWAMGGCAYREAADGVQDFDLIEVFDPATERWSTSSLTMPWPAAAHGAIRNGDWVYVVGGYSGPGIHERTVRFKADSGSSQTLPTLNAPRAAMGLGIVDNRLYAIGGWKGDGREVTNRVEVLDLAPLG